MTLGRLTRAAMAPFDRLIQRAKDLKLPPTIMFLCKVCWEEFAPEEIVDADGSFVTSCKKCGAPTDWVNAKEERIVVKNQRRANHDGEYTVKREGSGLAPGREEEHGRGRNPKG